jgi:hypothetical protein
MVFRGQMVDATIVPGPKQRGTNRVPMQEILTDGHSAAAHVDFQSRLLMPTGVLAKRVHSIKGGFTSSLACARFSSEVAG